MTDATEAPAVGVEQLADQVKVVALLRRALKQSSDELAAARDDFERDHAALMERIKDRAAAVDAAEAGLRALALAHHARTGETKPTAGVEVKLYATLRYDPQTALAWAKQTNLALVPESLDARAFEKVAKATPLPFVTTEHAARAQIATDLSKIL